MSYFYRIWYYQITIFKLFAWHWNILWLLWRRRWSTYIRGVYKCGRFFVPGTILLVFVTVPTIFLVSTELTHMSSSEQQDGGGLAKLQYWKAFQFRKFDVPFLQERLAVSPGSELEIRKFSEKSNRWTVSVQWCHFFLTFVHIACCDKFLHLFTLSISIFVAERRRSRHFLRQVFGCSAATWRRAILLWMECQLSLAWTRRRIWGALWIRWWRWYWYRTCRIGSQLRPIPVVTHFVSTRIWTVLCLTANA